MCLYFLCSKIKLEIWGQKNSKFIFLFNFFKIDLSKDLEYYYTIDNVTLQVSGNVKSVKVTVKSSNDSVIVEKVCILLSYFIFYLQAYIGTILIIFPNFRR